MRWFTRVFVASLLVLPPVFLAACPGEEAAQDNSADNPNEFAAARQVVLDYWAAFNRYDVEAALAYYTLAYATQEREEVEGDISQVDLFNVKLNVTGASQPVEIGNGTVEVKIVLSTPIGNRYLYYHLVKVNGVWKISQEGSYEP